MDGRGRKKRQEKGGEPKEDGIMGYLHKVRTEVFKQLTTGLKSR